MFIVLLTTCGRINSKPMVESGLSSRFLILGLWPLAFESSLPLPVIDKRFEQSEARQDDKWPLPAYAPVEAH